MNYSNLDEAFDLDKSMGGEGIGGGFSSGANVAAALKLLSKDMVGKTIVIIICDSGLKYLSTDLWNE